MYTAGADHTGQVYDREDNRVIASLTGHSKKVTGILPCCSTQSPCHTHTPSKAFSVLDCLSSFICEFMLLPPARGRLGQAVDPYCGSDTLVEMWVHFVDIKLLGKQDLVVTTSADKTARVWKPLEDGKYTATAVLKDHTGEVAAVAPHGTTDYFVTASLDKTWCFYDTTTATCIQQVWLPS